MVLVVEGRMGCVLRILWGFVGYYITSRVRHFELT